MRYLGVGMLFLSLCGAAFAQRQGQGQYWSLGGFGNVLYPGTGHAPQAGPGSPFVNNGLGFGRGVLSAPAFANHPEHRRTAIVPYPVYYGGYGYGYDPSVGYQQPGYGDQAPMVNANGAPSVVINQNFVPPQAYPQVREYAPSDTGQDQQQSGMKLYQTPPTHPYADAPQNTASGPARRTDDQATLYLIAFKDHSIVQALGYWMEGSTLHYVSAEHSLNQVSSDLIDRDLSQRLNDERGVEFRLPQPR
jgi:hypothetical protein